MPWQPTHAATLASIDLATVAAGAAAAFFCWAAACVAGALAAEEAGAGACAKLVTQATARAKSVVNNLVILRAQLGEGSFFQSTFEYIRRPCVPLPSNTIHEVPRLTKLRRHARPDACRQCVHHAEAPAARQRRARHGQDH